MVMNIGKKFSGKIEKNVWGGQGFLKNNEMAVFIKGGIEGQEVEYEITKKKEKFLRSKSTFCAQKIVYRNF